MRVEYASHLQALCAAVLRTSGPVLELGAGFYSTPVLHEICEAKRVELVTLENVPSWYERFAPLRSRRHRIELVRDWATCPLVDDPRWTVVFVDHDPQARRAAELARVKDASQARFIVVHDTEPSSRHQYPGLEATLAGFAYRRDFTELEPWTTVVSDVAPISAE